MHRFCRQQDVLRCSADALPTERPRLLASHPVAEEPKRALGIGENLVHISIGIEKADDLLADFEQALNTV